MAPKKPAKNLPPKELPVAPPTLPWPRLHPLLPASSLSLQSILPEQIVTIPNFFTSTLCNTYLSFLQKNISLTTTPGKPKRGEAVRVNDRFQTMDEVFAKTLWEQSGLKEIVEREEDQVGLWGGEVVGLNPNIRIYRYMKGQFFDKHYDDSNLLPSFPTPNASGSSRIPCETTWTLLIYLTGPADGIVGGETVFYTEATKKLKSEEIVVEPEKGLALLHRHGRDCMLHEGRLVSEDGGVGKWVLRSDLVVRRAK
ncbi:uncharacterized protein H6S33_010221 [Morchella sextelata]|uniref:uncharacterized protein n=1 Tax=Morchella sextelata TaxID=1174677 RepID=UPI001D03DD51|nr:uncharacterized protein H6S33_010221 [Morchella sextelata]KAH0612169.1 hypothetical protein H6S33_010221 [Morchella sextelata]